MAPDTATTGCVAWGRYLTAVSGCSNSSKVPDSASGSYGHLFNNVGVYMKKSLIAVATALSMVISIQVAEACTQTQINQCKSYYYACLSAHMPYSTCSANYKKCIARCS